MVEFRGKNRKRGEEDGRSSGILRKRIDKMKTLHTFIWRKGERGRNIEADREGQDEGGIRVKEIVGYAGRLNYSPSCDCVKEKRT